MLNFADVDLQVIVFRVQVGNLHFLANINSLSVVVDRQLVLRLLLHPQADLPTYQKVQIEFVKTVVSAFLQ